MIMDQNKISLYMTEDFGKKVRQPLERDNDYKFFLKFIMQENVIDVLTFYFLTFLIT